MPPPDSPSAAPKSPPTRTSSLSHSKPPPSAAKSLSISPSKTAPPSKANRSTPHQAVLVAGLWALEPKTPGTHAYTVDSPLQDTACKYGSSFSRAVEVDMADHRRLTISGTASIDPAGKTAHLGDVAAQVDLTMRVVRAILNSRGMDWTDITRGLVYFRRPEHLPFYERWRRFNEAPLMPVIVTNHTVCRDDLLYEIELDAVSERGSIVAPPRAYEKNRTSRRPDVPASTSLA